ncbi:MAG TPA: hypothetical protein PLD88_00365, partial [Candidatus Berkiella sp.]|nr:hypothetical protein [Candidatus Berkiella sp.]
KKVPQYHQSFHQLEALAEYLSMKIPLFIDTPKSTWLDDIIDSIDDDETKRVLLQTLTPIFKRFSKQDENARIANPFIR